MIKNDVYKYFGECLDTLAKMADAKFREELDKAEKKAKFQQESKESRENIQDSINRINEVLEYDLTTYEGYSKYMEYLGDLRKRAKDYNGVLKIICGKTGEELVDEVAQQATTIYQEAKEKREAEKRDAEKKKAEEAKKQQRDLSSGNDVCKSGKRVINECDDYCKKDSKNDDEPCTSQLVSDDFYDHVCNIVTKYMEESWIPYSKQYYGAVDEDEADYVTDELIEFACWLSNQN